MPYQTGVDHSRVRRNRGARLKAREQAIRAPSPGMHEGYLADCSRCLRAASLILITWPAIVPEIKSDPIAIVLHAVSIVDRAFIITCQIGTELHVIRQDCIQL